MYETCQIRVNPTTFPYSKYLQATITKPLSIKTRETICKRLKLMCKFFETDGQKDF